MYHSRVDTPESTGTGCSTDDTNAIKLGAGQVVGGEDLHAQATHSRDVHAVAAVALIVAGDFGDDGRSPVLVPGADTQRLGTWVGWRFRHMHGEVGVFPKDEKMPAWPLDGAVERRVDLLG